MSITRAGIAEIASSIVGQPKKKPLSVTEKKQAEAYYELQRIILASAANKSFNEDRSGTVPNFYSTIGLIKAQKDDDEKTITAFFDGLSEKTFIQVQTPHPTEVWGAEAVKAQRRLRKFVDANINKILSGNIDFDVRKGVLDRFVALQVEMKKPFWELKDATGATTEKVAKKTAAIAAKDSLVASERFYKGTGFIVANIYQAFQANGVEITPERIMKELAKRKFVEWHTWAPGDNDGNPSLTLTELERGSRLQLEAVNRRYILDLAVMASELPEGAAKDQIRSVISSLIETINKKSDKANGKLADWAKYLRENGREKAAEEILKVIDIRRDEISALGDPTVYHDIKTFQKDLTKLGKAAEIAALKETLQGVELSRLELLKLNASIFGERALKAEYRQNTAVFEIAFAQVTKLIGQDGIDPEAMLKIFRDSPDLAVQIRSRVEDFLAGNKDEFERLLKEFVGKGKDIPIESRKMFYTYDILTKLQAIAKDPEGFPTILLAECGGFKNIMMGQFLLELMCIDREKPANKVCGLFEDTASVNQIMDTVDNLLKYQDDIIIMIAGSDLLKSGGVGGKVISKDVFNQLEEKAQHLRVGQKITVYLGNGSAIHRNSVVLEFYRTTQGIEMRLNGPCDVATEYQAVTSRFLTDKIRRENGCEDKRIKPTAHDSLMNLSNILNFSTIDQVNNINDHQLRTVDYQEKYLATVFGNLVETFPNQEMESAVTTAPRPKFRPDYNTDPNKVKVAEVGHQKMRAIGYGSNLYTASWGAVHAYFDISEFADKCATDGRLPDAKEAAKTYLNSPYNVQDSINRSLYNQALFQPDMGLKFLEARFGNAFSVNPSFNEEGKLMFEIKSGDKFIKINAEEYFLEMQKPLAERDAEINKASYNLAGFFKTNQIPSSDEAKMAYEATISSMVLYWEGVKANRTGHDLLIELALNDRVIEPKEAIELRKNQNPSSADLRDLMAKINPDLGHELNEKADLLAFNREIVHKYFEEHIQQVRKLGLEGDDLKAAVTKLQTELHNNEELNYSLREIKRIAESPLEVPKHAQMFAKNCDELAIAA